MVRVCFAGACRRLLVTAGKKAQPRDTHGANWGSGKMQAPVWNNKYGRWGFCMWSLEKIANHLTIDPWDQKISESDVEAIWSNWFLYFNLSGHGSCFGVVPAHCLVFADWRTMTDLQPRVRGELPIIVASTIALLRSGLSVFGSPTQWQTSRGRRLFQTVCESWVKNQEWFCFYKVYI